MIYLWLKCNSSCNYRHFVDSRRAAKFVCCVACQPGDKTITAGQTRGQHCSGYRIEDKETNLNGPLHIETESPWWNLIWKIHGFVVNLTVSFAKFWHPWIRKILVVIRRVQITSLLINQSNYYNLKPNTNN